MPASTLPTKSVPTSAALVKMPPPSRAKIEIKLAPKPKPIKALTSLVRKKNPATDNSPKATTKKPVMEPALKAKDKAGANPFRDASAVLSLERTATFIPIYPAKAEATAPTKNPSEVKSHRVR